MVRRFWEPDGTPTFTDPVKACARRKSRPQWACCSMKVFRRRLASCALTLIAVQLALLFAAPASACCKRPGAAAAGAQIAADDEAPDCCPPGAHRDGECPLHRGASSEARGAKRATHCRMTCGNTTSPQILLGA